MAEDALVLLDYVGWKGKREVNIVGVSLGGMIAIGAMTILQVKILLFIAHAAGFQK